MFKRILRYSLFGLIGLLLLTALVIGVRYAQAAAAVNAFDKLAPPPLTGMGVTEKLTILPLYENAVANDALAGGNGVAYLVQTDTATLLIDTGYNPDSVSPSPLEQNMAHLGVDLAGIDVIALSHHHPDHVGSIAWWQQGTFSLGNEQVDLGERRVLAPTALTYPGSAVEVAAAPQVLAPGVASLGTLPFVDVFPLWLLRPAMTEQVLAINVADVGVILITGCGHPGLERIVSHAEAVLGQPVAGIVGGLHYGLEDSPKLHEGIALLGERSMGLVAISPHDTGPAGLAAFAAAFPLTYRPVIVGEPITVR